MSSLREQLLLMNRNGSARRYNLTRTFSHKKLKIGASTETCDDCKKSRHRVDFLQLSTFVHSSFVPTEKIVLCSSFE